MVRRKDEVRDDANAASHALPTDNANAPEDTFDPWSLPPEELERLVGRKLPRTLWQARAAFLCEFDQLYREHPGKYVAYHGATRIGEPCESNTELWRRCEATGIGAKECTSNFTRHPSESTQVGRTGREPARIIHHIQVMKRPRKWNLIHNPNPHFLRNWPIHALARLGEVTPGSGQNERVPTQGSPQLRCFRFQLPRRPDTRNVAPDFPR
jgi:hypothetical protein